MIPQLFLYFCLVCWFALSTKKVLELYLQWHNRWYSSDGSELVKTAGVRLPWSDLSSLARSPLTFTREYHRKFGDIFQVWLGWKPLLVCSSSDGAHEFYKSQAYHLKSADFALSFGYPFKPLLGNCLGLLYGDQYEAAKKLWHDLFTFQRVKQFFKEYGMNASIRTYFTQGREQFTADVYSLCRRLPFFVVVDFVYGPNLSESDKEELTRLEHEHAELMEISANRFVNKLPGFGILPTTLSSRTSKFISDWRTFNRKIYSEKMTGSSVHHIIMDKVFKGELDEIIALQTLDEIILANLDVVVPVLAWLITDLALNPHVVQLIRDENQAFKQDGVQPARSYVDMVIWESSLHRPVSPLTIPEFTHEDMEICGFAIPKGTAVSFDLITMRDDFMGGDSTFNPLRFKASSSSIDIKWNRFGLGKRKCLGRYLGHNMLKQIVKELVQQYDLEPLEHCEKNSVPLMSGRPFLTPNFCVQFNFLGE